MKKLNFIKNNFDKLLKHASRACWGLLTLCFIVPLFLVNASAAGIDEFSDYVGVYLPYILLYIVLIITIFLICFIVLVAKSGSTKREKRISEQESSDLTGDEQNEMTDGEDTGDGKYHRFKMLSEIDETMQGKSDINFDSSISLEELCKKFRNFSAEKLKLYYSIEDIRSFISGMAVSHFILMQGISGTGKTSLAYAFGQFLSNPSAIIPIQPMWKESSDMLGYYNEFTNHFNETNMLAAMYRAQYTKSICIIVLDEVNIARIEYYFAELLSLMELPNADDRRIRVISGNAEGDPRRLYNGEIRLSDNIWFIGTANNDDSTFAISDKVYDRAMIINLNKKAEPFDVGYSYGVGVSAEHFQRIVDQAQARYQITDRNRRRLEKLDKFLQKNLHVSFGNRIMRQLEKYVSVYIACGGREIDAIDDILTKKILRKLESQNPIYIKNMISELCDYIDEIYGEGELPSCREYLHRIEVSM